MKEAQTKTELKKLARLAFHPKGKKPYIFNGKPLNDLQDLKDYLVAFTGKEALWVASWLEYLGDTEIAGSIRKDPGHFKRLVSDRYRQLLPFA